MLYIYKCPNCGRTYNYGEEIHGLVNCMNCRYPLKKAEEVKRVKHPELSKPKVIGTVPGPDTVQVQCPYCHSTNTKKISDTTRVLDALFGGVYALPRMTKEWHCKNCNSDF